MDYVKDILSGLAAIFIAEFAFSWPFFRTSKATGLAALSANFVESIFSPRFWIVGVLLFGLFVTASRSRIILRVLFFWIPQRIRNRNPNPPGAHVQPQHSPDQRSSVTNSGILDNIRQGLRGGCCVVDVFCENSHFDYRREVLPPDHRKIRSKCNVRCAKTFIVDSSETAAKNAVVNLIRSMESGIPA
jgi:hypothetical protein